MNEKQQQLQFEKGITNVPSDLLCSDNTLEESVGMIYDNSEHRVIQKPAVFVDTETPIVPILEGFHLLYVHKFNDEERYIGYTFDDSLGHHANYLCYATKSGTTLTYRELEAPYTETTMVTSIGKTLIVTNQERVYYFLWKNTVIDGELTPDYKNLGDIPDAKFDFWMERDERFVDTTTKETYDAVQKDNCEGGLFDYDTDQHPIGVDQPDLYDDVLIGLYSANKKAIATRKKFCRPFFVRTALELHDGTYTHISQPVLMIPFIKDNSFALSVDVAGIRLHTFFASLYFTQKQDLSEWADIIKNVVIFVSNEVEIYELIPSQPESQITGNAQACTINGIYRFDNGQTEISTYNTSTFTISINGVILHSFSYYSYQPLKRKEEKDLLNDLKSVSTFYKLCEIGIRDYQSKTTVEQFFDSAVLTNIYTQEQLPYDDYYSRCQLYPLYIYSYNSRLNLANVKRSIFEGYDFFLPFDNSSAATYDFYVRIQTDVEKVWVHHQKSTKQKQGIYFYYPDSRADRVTIYKTINNTTTCVCDHELTEHSGLNGAYYLKGLPGTTIAGLTDEETVTVDSIEGFDPNRVNPDVNNRYNNSYLERLANYIITSEVNNPWAYLAQGYFKVGTGEIRGMSSITQALSQGQFGQYPLLVFSESGIWALSVASTGYYSSIQPMSREVCNNPGSITQTDGAVFFTSEKGLMVVVGSEVKCVSEQLSGRETNFTGEIAMGNIRDYMKDCFIAYDYRDSLLWIFNNSRQTNTDYCYVYAIKSGTFGKYRFANAITNVVNNYPDYLLQSGSTLFSLTGRQNINLDTDPYSGLMITRPMKLENGLALKSLMQIKNLRQFSSGATLQLTLYASNDCEHWVQIPSLRGTPFKYWRFRFDFTQMKATDRYAGTIVITQERRIDKLR